MKKKPNIKKIIKSKINFTQKTGITEKPILNTSQKSVNVEKSKPVLSNNKKIVKKTIVQEYRNTEIKNHSKQDKAFAAGNPNFTAKKNGDIPVVLKDYGVYLKEANVDFDVVICVTSFERYVKVRRILKQLHTQESKYTFKFILLNDASTDVRYDTLQKEFPNIVYLKNDENGGKVNYWKTVNKLWAVGKTYKSHAFLQIDDDFILCTSFLDRLLDEFFKKKEEDNRNMVFSYHMYGYKKNEPLADWWYNGISIAIDGGTLFDSRFLMLFDYYIDIGNKTIAAHTSTFFWDTIVQHIREFGVKVYRMPKSLAWHDGNFDSKLNYVARQSKKSYTKNFIDGENKYNTDVDLSDLNFDDL